MSRGVERLAPELLELLRRAAGQPVELARLELTTSPSVVTLRRVVYYLRELGAPIGSDPVTASGSARRAGYWLEDLGWRMPGPEVRVIDQASTVERERVVYSVDLTKAKLAALVRELERRGYEVTLRPPAPTEER